MRLFRRLKLPSAGCVLLCSWWLILPIVHKRIVQCVIPYKQKPASLAGIWRRGRDSNPRGDLRPPIDLANRPLQPLGYLSVANWNYNRLAEGVGFEPTVPLPARRFSRPLPSTTRSSLHAVAYNNRYTPVSRGVGEPRPPPKHLPRPPLGVHALPH